MKQILLTILKLVLILVVLLGLVIALSVSFNVLQRLIVGNETYYLIASRFLNVYSIITSCLCAFMVFLLLFREESKIVRGLLFKLRILIPLFVVLIVSYVVLLFNMTVVYEGKVVRYNIFNIKGKNYNIENISNRESVITKTIKGYKLKYYITLDNKKIEIFNNATDFGLELKKFDHISILDKYLDEKNISKDKDSKYLEEYLKVLNKEEKEKLNSIFK